VNCLLSSLRRGCNEGCHTLHLQGTLHGALRDDPHSVCGVFTFCNCVKVAKSI
jgi:hypothetical protein